MAELFSSTPYAALTARERIWAAIREMKTVTVREVADRCDAKADAVRGYFAGLVAAGVLDVIHRGTGGKHSVYTLKRDLGVHAPRVRRDGRSCPIQSAPGCGTPCRFSGSLPPASLRCPPHSRSRRFRVPKRWTIAAGWRGRAIFAISANEKFRFVPARHTGAKAPQLVLDHACLSIQISISSSSTGRLQGGTTNDEPRESRGRLGNAAAGLDRKLATLRRQGAAEDCGGSFRLPGHCEPRHSARPREARLHPEPRRAPSRDFHHPLPRARSYQPEGVPGQPAKAVFIHQPHRGAAFPVMPGILPVQRTQKGGTP